MSKDPSIQPATIPELSPSPLRDGAGLRAAVAQRLQINNRIAIAVLWGVTGIIATVFIAVILYIVAQGLPYLFNGAFYGLSDLGVGREIYNTFYILIFTELFLFPISLAAAIYLVEYARPGPLVTAIQFASETLSGVPSIILGMFGIAVFGHFISGIPSVTGFTRLTGALTLLCLNFPLSLRLFETALASVPRDLREGGLAIGATRWHTIRNVVLPSALPGLITGLILSSGKIIGEAAALILTMGELSPSSGYDPSKIFSFSSLNPLNPLVSSDTLAIHIWYLKTQELPGNITADQASALAAGSAALLILLLLLINIGARSLGRVIQRRLTAA